MPQNVALRGATQALVQSVELAATAPTHGAKGLPKLREESQPQEQPPSVPQLRSRGRSRQQPPVPETKEAEQQAPPKEPALTVVIMQQFEDTPSDL